MCRDSHIDNFRSVVCQWVTCCMVLRVFANLTRSLHVAPSAMQTITKGGKAAFLLWITKHQLLCHWKSVLATVCVLLNQYPQTEYPCPLSPTGMTKPLQQLRITPLMGRGAQTLIVPDTNTAASVPCMSILYISGSAEASWVTGMLRAYRVSSVAHGLGFADTPGRSRPAESRPLLSRWSSCCRCGALPCQAGGVPPVHTRGAGQRRAAVPGREGQGRARRRGNGARALWRPPCAGTGGMGARGVIWELRRAVANLLVQLYCWETL